MFHFAILPASLRLSCRKPQWLARAISSIELSRGSNRKRSARQFSRVPPRFPRMVRPSNRSSRQLLLSCPACAREESRNYRVRPEIQRTVERHAFSLSLARAVTTIGALSRIVALLQNSVRKLLASELH